MGQHRELNDAQLRELRERRHPFVTSGEFWLGVATVIVGVSVVVGVVSMFVS